MESNRTSKRYKWIGIWLSVVWVLVVLTYLGATKQNPFCLKLNEFGDFFAGAFGPIGILWIVLGFWQQGDELRNSVKELNNSVKQQQALVNISKEQLEEHRAAGDEERNARRMELLPVLTLSTHGGSGSASQGYNSGMKLSNSGQDCTELKIADLEDSQQTLPTIAALPNGKSEVFQFRYSSVGHMDFEMKIEFRARDENRYMQIFRLQRDDSGRLGFKITKGDPPVRI